MVESTQYASCKRDVTVAMNGAHINLLGCANHADDNVLCWCGASVQQCSDVPSQQQSARCPWPVCHYVKQATHIH